MLLLHLCENTEAIQLPRHDEIQEDYIYLMKLLTKNLHPLIAVLGFYDIYLVL